MSECNHSPTVQLWALTNDNKCPVCLAARLAEAEEYLDPYWAEAYFKKYPRAAGSATVEAAVVP